MGELKKLFSLFLKLDFRDKEKSGKRKILGVLVTYLLTNGILSLNNFNGYDEFSFAVISFSINIFFISFIVLNDFDNLFLAKNYYNGLAALPLKQNNMFAAKFISAAVIIFTFFIFSSASQIVFFYLFTNDAVKTALFLVCSMLFNFAFMGLILFLYLIIINSFAGKTNIFIYALQMIFFFFVMYSSTATSKAYRLGKKNILEIEFVRFLPQVFFAKAIYSPLLIPVLVIITAVIYFLLYKYMSGRYHTLQSKILPVSKINKRRFSFSFWGNFIRNNFARGNIQKASYDLLRCHLRNSKFLRTKYIPMLLLPVIICVVVLVFFPDGVTLNGMSKAGSTADDSLLVLTPTITFLFIISARMLYSNTRIADEYSSGGESLLNTLPIPDIKQLNLGISKYILFNFLLPVFVLAGLLLLIRLDSITVSLNLLYIISVVYLLNSVFLLFEKRLPFSQDNSKFNSLSKLGEVMLNMLFGVLIFIIQIFVFQNIIFVIAAAAIFFGVSFLINRN
ncbi:MAG: hypothetical protein K1X86_02270 [Ignavibacteria bacterium]|nr:hypothetical protein [Ignavibacteria bacterium]